MGTQMGTPGAWAGELVHDETVTIYPKGKDGKTRKVVVNKYHLELTKGNLTMTFKVSKGKNGHPVITDDREVATGHAKPNNKQYQGEAHCKNGRERKLTVTGWAAEHANRLTKEGMDRVFQQLALVFG